MPESTGWFAQAGYRVRLDWGRRGAREAAERGDILVIVDTLRFSTTAATIVQHGGLLFPCLEIEDVAEVARRVGAEAGGYRASESVRYTLSPLDYLELAPGTRIALPSPNGATCARYASVAPAVFVGALINAEAVANAVAAHLTESDVSVTVIACGERWTTPSEDGELHFAIEDYLGAGAILSYLPSEFSPEAWLCLAAFQGVRDDLESILWSCGSGIELREKGLDDDVRHSARLNLYDIVPIIRSDHLKRM